MTFSSKKFAVILTGAALMVAGAAGCGGDDDADALSKEDFIAQADALCAEHSEATEETTNEAVAAYQAGDFEAAAGALEEVNESTIGLADDIKELTPPEEDQATIDEMLALTDEQQVLAEDFVVAFGQGDDAGITQISEELDSLTTEFDAIADEYGFVDCGSAGTA